MNCWKTSRITPHFMLDLRRPSQGMGTIFLFYQNSPKRLPSLFPCCAHTQLENNTFKGFSAFVQGTAAVRFFQSLTRLRRPWPQSLCQFHTHNFTAATGLQVMRLCSGWPTLGTNEVHLRFAIPILWVISDFDNNCPTEWATDSFYTTPDSSLVVRHGAVHGTFQILGQPARDIEVAYLLPYRRVALPRERYLGDGAPAWSEARGDSESVQHSRRGCRWRCLS